MADVIWAKDEPMPMDEVEAVREEVIAVIAGTWRHGDVARFPKLRAILEVSGGFPSPAAARQMVWNHEAFREGNANWSHTDFGDTFTLYDKPAGFIGFGGLARSLMPLLA